MASSGRNCPESNIRICRTDSGGTQTTQFEQVEQTATMSKELQLRQKLNLITGDAGNIEIWAISCTQMIEKLHVLIPAQGLISTGYPGAEGKGTIQDVEVA